MKKEADFGKGRKKAELLAPAGSYESLVAAVNAGADAVYMGGAMFGARAYAETSREDVVQKGIDYAHRFGVKVYLTVNTLLKETETAILPAYIRPYYEGGLDAVIVQDLGVLQSLREAFPDLALHMSTQANVTGPESVSRLQRMGISRVVLARELSLGEIRSIIDETGIQVECFVHGALCYAYSGQCLMSSLIGGRSANRGQCAQTCRLPYRVDRENKEGKREILSRREEPHLLSCKDLCSLDILPDILEAGVHSLKIEGRMKSPVYTAGAVSIWRQYLDQFLESGRRGYRVDPEDRRRLLSLFDRGGQTSGYYDRHNGADMIALRPKPDFRRVDEKYHAYLEKTYVKGIKTLSLFGEAILREGEPMVFQVRKTPHGEILAAVKGAVPQRALSRAMTEEEVLGRLQKTGGSGYSFAGLELRMDKGLFVPVKDLNGIRRELLRAAEEALLMEGRKRRSSPLPPAKPVFSKPAEGLPDPEEREGGFVPRFHVLCETKKQLDALLSFLEEPFSRGRVKEAIREVGMESDAVSPFQWKDLVESLRDKGFLVNLYMPHIFRREAREFFGCHRKDLLQAGFDGFILRNMESLVFLQDILEKEKARGYRKSPALIADYTMYAYNGGALFALRGMGISRCTLPLELHGRDLSSLPEVTGLEREMLVYGRIPMMVSAQCLKKNTSGCDRISETVYLQDRMTERMPVKNRCLYCYNTIYNAKPLSTLSRRELVRRLRPDALRLWFTTESGPEVNRVLQSYLRAYLLNEETGEPVRDYTLGHLKRGI